MENEGTGKTILAVDDKEENRRVVRKRLVRRGYRVITAASGEEAVCMAPTEEPDLILTGLRLPVGIDGITATRRLKELPAVARFTVAAILASVSPDDIQRALDAGCRGFIRKPIDTDELPEEVSRHIVDGDTPRWLPTSGGA